MFFSAAPEYWKNCTDEKMRSFVNKLFLVLTISQALKLLFCAVVLIARFLKQHGAGHGRRAGRREACRFRLSDFLLPAGIAEIRPSPTHSGEF